MKLILTYLSVVRVFCNDGVGMIPNRCSVDRCSRMVCQYPSQAVGFANVPFDVGENNIYDQTCEELREYYNLYCMTVFPRCGIAVPITRDRSKTL